MWTERIESQMEGEWEQAVEIEVWTERVESQTEGEWEQAVEIWAQEVLFAQGSGGVLPWS